MHSIHFFAVVGLCLFALKALHADVQSAPFGFSNQYDASLVGVDKNGISIANKVNFSDGKIRLEFTERGVHLIIIIRPDLEKVYIVHADSKIVAENRYYPEQFKKLAAITSKLEGRFDIIGPDMVDGVSYIKYKVTDTDGKISYWWINAVTKNPMKMTREDGSLTFQWKTYKTGPQDASLFEPPSGYKDIGIGKPIPKALIPPPQPAPGSH